MKYRTEFKNAADLKAYLDELERIGTAIYKKSGLTPEAKKIQDTFAELEPVLDEMEAAERRGTL